MVKILLNIEKNVDASKRHTSFNGTEMIPVCTMGLSMSYVLMYDKTRRMGRT